MTICVHLWIVVWEYIPAIIYIVVIKASILWLHLYDSISDYSYYC
jgi:hypothetical protein